MELNREQNESENSKDNNTSSSVQEKRTAFDWNMFLDRTLVLNDLREKKQFIDVMLTSLDGGEVPVHLTVISALGKKLTDVIYNRINDPSTKSAKVEDNTGTLTEVKRIELKEFQSKDILQIIVDCAYTGFISADYSIIWDILRVSEVYDMKDVIQATCTYLIYQLNDQNCIKFLKLGLKHRHKLKTAAWNVIKVRFPIIVAQNLDFTSLEIHFLESLIDDDELNVQKEEIIWNAIRLWVSFDIKERKKYLLRLLNKMRFGRIDLNFLENVVINDEIIVQDHQAHKKICEMINKIKDENDKNLHRLDGRGVLVSVKEKFMRPRVPYEVVFAIGGWQEGVPTTLTETYDVRTNKWFQYKISHQFPRAYHGMEVLHGIVYLIGGTNGTEILSSVHCFDPSNGRWFQRANMYEQRCYVSTGILNDFIYALGGHNGLQRVRTVEKYDHKTNQWVQSKDMNLARSDGCAAVFNEKIYIAGGLNDQVIENSVEMYNPEDDTWTFIQPMSSPRTSLALVVFHNSLYALGGNNGFERLDTVEKYDFSSGSWSPIQSMRSRRSTFAACVVEDKLYVIGGYNGHTPINLVEAYDEVAREWVQVRSLKHDRSGLAICVLKGLPNTKDYTYIGNMSKSNGFEVKSMLFTRRNLRNDLNQNN